MSSYRLQEPSIFNRCEDQSFISNQFWDQQSIPGPIHSRPPTKGPDFPQPQSPHPVIPHQLAPVPCHAQPLTPGQTDIRFQVQDHSDRITQMETVSGTPNMPKLTNPALGSIWVYLLQFCPRQVNVCYGCGVTVKPSECIPPSP